MIALGQSLLRAGRKARAIGRTGVLHRLAYGWELVVRALFLVVILFVFRQLYSRVLPAGSPLAGYDAVTVLWYLAFTEAIVTAAPRLGGLVDEEVRSGHVATFLLRPIDYVAYHRWRYLGEAAVTFPVHLAVGGGMAWLLVGPPPVSLIEVPALLVPVALGLLVHFEISMALALSAFWIEDSTPFFWVYQKILFVLGGLLLPLEFFPGWLRSVADALPFSVILHGPARFALDPNLAGFGPLVGKQLLWWLVLAAGTRGLYRLGSRRVCIHGG